MFLYILIGIIGLLTLYNLLALKFLRKKTEEIKDSVQDSIKWAKDDIRTDIEGMKSVMKVLAGGGKVTPDMIDDGRPYADLSAAEAHKLLSSPNHAVVLDVRTNEEYMAGHIPGCKLIPVDEVENR